MRTSDRTCGQCAATHRSNGDSLSPWHRVAFWCVSLPRCFLWILTVTACCQAFISLPAIARVDQRRGTCFQRSTVNPTVVRALGPCRVVVGTLGMQRAIWGFVLSNGVQINAWQDVGRPDVMVNGKQGFLLSPSGRSPDRLLQGHYFCLGVRGMSQIICARPAGGTI